MKFGVTMFTTDYSMSPSELAMAAEERDFESLWLPEHSHIPIPRVSPWPGGGEVQKCIMMLWIPSSLWLLLRR